MRGWEVGVRLEGVQGQAGFFFLGLPWLVTENQGGGLFLCLPFPSPPHPHLHFLSHLLLHSHCPHPSWRAGCAESLGDRPGRGARRGPGAGARSVPRARRGCAFSAPGCVPAARRGVSRPRAAGAAGARIIPAARP